MYGPCRGGYEGKRTVGGQDPACATRHNLNKINDSVNYLIKNLKPGNFLPLYLRKHSKVEDSKL